MHVNRLSFVILAAIAIALNGCSSTSDKNEPVTGSRQTRSSASKSDGDLGTQAAKNALAMRGKPYRYGGYSPQGFDCSGLVHYSYARAGADLPRNTNGLWVRSRTVSRSDIRLG